MTGLSLLPSPAHNSKMLPLLAVAEETALYYAIGLMITVGIVMVVAIIKDGADGGLKIWTAIGTILGAAGAYFFTKESNQQALARKDAEKAVVVSQVDALKEANDRLVNSGKLQIDWGNTNWGKLIPAIQTNKNEEKATMQKP